MKTKGTIDHFHYDVTRAKASGSCSKDRAQGRSIAGKVSKNQQKRHVGQGKLPGVLQSYVLDCYANSEKCSIEFLMFFFSINEKLRSVVIEDFYGKLSSQILDTECVEGKLVLTMCQYISLMRKRIEGEEGVSEIGDIEPLEQFLNNRTK